MTTFGDMPLTATYALEYPRTGGVYLVHRTTGERRLLDANEIIRVERVFNTPDADTTLAALLVGDDDPCATCGFPRREHRPGYSRAGHPFVLRLVPARKNRGEPPPYSTVADAALALGDSTRTATIAELREQIKTLEETYARQRDASQSGPVHPLLHLSDKLLHTARNILTYLETHP